jgi:hypothetical protein
MHLHMPFFYKIAYHLLSKIAYHLLSKIAYHFLSKIAYLYITLSMTSNIKRLDSLISQLKDLEQDINNVISLGSDIKQLDTYFKKFNK